VRYGHSKEQSAEVLRLTLPLMARQDAAFHPLSYALWYEHAAGLNPLLSAVLNEKLAARASLTEAEVYRLHACHIAARDIELAESLQLELKTVLESAAAGIGSAAQSTADLEKELQAQSAHLDGSPSAGEIQNVVRELTSIARRMQIGTSQVSAFLTDRLRSVDEIGERMGQAQSDALLDPLTGLKNRRGLDRALAQLDMNRRGFAGAALLLADIDHFKSINDTHGHLIGDKVLGAVAHVLRSNIKGRDIAGRIGGDEFAVVLPDTPLPGAMALAELIRASIAQGRIQRKDGAEVVGQVTLSLGVTIGADGDSMESMFERADSVLYEAKRSGRNRVAVAHSPGA